MKYRYSDKQSFEFLASGSVLYGVKGSPNFPVRLSNEIFKRCLQHLGKKNDITLYDPCCGGGYLLATIGFLNYGSIKMINGSDINADFLKTANKNLSLLSNKGLKQRKIEIRNLYQKYSKTSHLASLSFLEKFYNLVNENSMAIPYEIFERDILSPVTFNAKRIKANMVITDVPYNQLVKWSGQQGIDLMLDNLADQLEDDAAVAVIHDKSQKRKNTKYSRLEKFKVGKRIIEILKFEK